MTFFYFGFHFLGKTKPRILTVLLCHLSTCGCEEVDVITSNNVTITTLTDSGHSQETDKFPAISEIADWNSKFRCALALATITIMLVIKDYRHFSVALNIKRFTQDTADGSQGNVLRRFVHVVARGVVSRHAPDVVDERKPDFGSDLLLLNNAAERRTER